MQIVLPHPFMPASARAAILFTSLSLAAGVAHAACEHPVGRLASAESAVEMRPAGGEAWIPISPSQPLCEGDQVTVRAPGRASVVLHDDILVRLDQNTTLTLTRVAPDADAELGLLEGLIHVITRHRERFEVNTPFVNAMVEGTEFSVKSGDGLGRVVVTEGQVRVRGAATGADSEQRLSDGEAALVRAGGAPGRLEIRALDTVRWAIHYPQIVWLDAASRGRLPPAEARVVEAAQAAMARSRHAEALQLLESLRRDGVPAGVSAEVSALHVSALLALGRIEPARKRLAAMASSGGAAALALESLLAVTVNDVALSTALAHKALAADADSAAAQLALSYALQAGGDVPAAYAAAVRAAALAAENPFVWTRRAELALSLSRSGDGRASAEQARSLAPGLGRGLALLGFADLLEGRSVDAASALAAAVAADPADPFARFAQGMLALRRGEIATGRAALELAVLLDPTNAELRSILGRAYLEEQRSALAADQFALARHLDPGSPTPWFFDAYRHLQANAPVEALAGVDAALARNDNRAVFRGPELIDSDRAARSTLQGLAYGEIGFERPMRDAALAAMRDDPLSASALRLLADSYAREGGLESARASAYLQMSLRQPLGAAPVPPQRLLPGIPILGGSRLLSPEEVTDIAARKPQHFSVSLLGGSQDTFGGTVTAARAWERAQISLGSFRYRSDGVGADDRADVDLTVNRLAAQFAATADTSLHAEVWQSDESGGDIGQRFFQDQALDRAFDTRRRLGRLAFRTLFDAHSELIGSFSLSDNAAANTDTLTLEPGLTQSGLIDERAKGRDLGVQYQRATGPYAVTVGASHYSQDRTTRFEDRICCVPDELVFSSPPSRHDEQLDNIYAYLRYAVTANADAHAAVTHQRFASDDPLVDGRERTNGKLGLVLQASDRLRVRAAWMQRLAGIYAQPGLEPTAFAGFVQQFDDPVGTRSSVRAVALDARPIDTVSTSLEWFRRALSVPNRNCGFAPCAADVEVTGYRFHAGWQVNAGLALTVGWERDATSQRTDASASYPDPIAVRTTRLPLRAWMGLGDGWSLGAEALRIGQRVSLLSEGATLSGDSDFWLANFRLRHVPGDARWSVDLELRNAFDRSFRFQDPNLFGTENVPRLLPERSIQVALRYQF